jgi:hypothetical protein
MENFRKALPDALEEADTTVKTTLAEYLAICIAFVSAFGFFIKILFF